jgi:hypothetical protein
VIKNSLAGGPIGTARRVLQIYSVCRGDIESNVLNPFKYANEGRGYHRTKRSRTNNENFAKS